MDIHKPKPWHGLSEFLKEYAIIVLGVLTALALEQAVEWLHWHHQVGAARTVLKADLTHLLQVAVVRGYEAPCVDRRLDAATDIVDRAAVTGRLPPTGLFYNPLASHWALGGWGGIMASGVATHLPEAQFINVGDVSNKSSDLQSFNFSELIEWTKIYAIVGPGRKFETAEQSAILDAVRNARYYNKIIRLAVDQVSDEVVQSGILSITEVRQAERQELEWIRTGAEAIPICSAIGPVPTRDGSAPLFYKIPHQVTLH